MATWVREAEPPQKGFVLAVQHTFASTEVKLTWVPYRYPKIDSPKMTR